MNYFYNISMSLLISRLMNLNSFNYSPQCVQFINITDSQTVNLIQRYFQLSGKGLNQLGNYYQCLQTPNSNYFLTYIASFNIKTDYFIGICFSQNCKSGDILELSQALQLPYSFWNVVEPAKINSPFNIKTYLTIIIILLFTFACIFATVRNYLQKQKKRKNLSRWSIILNYFSLQQSMLILRKQDQIKYLNGIRSICFILIFFGHQLYLRLNYIRNQFTLSNQLKKNYILISISYIFAVDVFFYLGGFLLGKLFLKYYYKNKNITQFPLAILNRIFRFWPLLIITALIHAEILPFLGNGPLYYLIPKYLSNCNKWIDLLFIGNFFSDVCMRWLWYLEVDIQLYVISIFLLLIVIKWNRYWSYLIQLIIVISNILYCYFRSVQKEYKIISNYEDFYSQKGEQYYFDLYVRPWSRTGPYFLGLSLGIFYHFYELGKIDQEYQKPLFIKLLKYRLIRYSLFIIGFSLVFFITYLPITLLHETQWSQHQHSLYLSLTHLLYPLGINFMTIPFLFGYSSPIKWFLQLPIFQYISKISFSCFMLHYIFLLRQTYNISITYYITPWTPVVYGLGDLIMVLFIGLVFSLVIQFPLSWINNSITRNNEYQKKVDNFEYRIIE